MSPIEPEILLKGRLMEGRTTQPDRRLAFGRAPRWVVRPMLCAVDGVDGRCRPTPLLGPRQDDSSGGIELHDRNLPAAAAPSSVVSQPRSWTVVPILRAIRRQN